MSELKLFTQSYREAKESGLVNKLDGIGIVSGHCDANISESPFCERVIESANAELERNATHKGADFVFGIDYQVYERENMRSILATGDAYRESQLGPIVPVMRDNEPAVYVDRGRRIKGVNT